MSNYPPGFSPCRSVSYEFTCPKCDNYWEGTTTEELGTLVDDNISICDECGHDANDPYTPECPECGVELEEELEPDEVCEECKKEQSDASVSRNENGS